MNYKRVMANVGFSNLFKIMKTYATVHSLTTAEHTTLCISEYACCRSLDRIFALLPMVSFSSHVTTAANIDGS